MVKFVKLHNYYNINFQKIIFLFHLKQCEMRHNCLYGRQSKFYCSASEVRHPSKVRHLHFMTILKSFNCPVTAYMYTLLLEEAIPFI